MFYLMLELILSGLALFPILAFNSYIQLCLVSIPRIGHVAIFCNFRRNNTTGSSFSSSRLTAIIKALVELHERGNVYIILNQSNSFISGLPGYDRSVPYGAATSIFLEKARTRAIQELVERDALVNFWVCKRFIAKTNNTILPPKNLALLINIEQFGYRVKSYLIKSHQYQTVLSVLITQDSSVILVGCSSKNTIKEAAASSIEELAMLFFDRHSKGTLMAVNAGYKFSTEGEFLKLENQITQHFEFTTQEKHVRNKYLFTTLFFSNDLSGMLFKKIIFRAHSFLALYPKMNIGIDHQMTIPCFGDFILDDKI
jgi:hypothetical protein